MAPRLLVRMLSKARQPFCHERLVGSELAAAKVECESEALEFACTSSMPSLAQLCPDLCTWWIPESVVCAVPYLVAAAGAVLARTGRQILRIYY